MALFVGTDANEYALGLPEADLIWGLGGNDLLNGEEGDDELHGGAGSDELYGGLGNDLIFGAGGRDFLYGDGGDDLLSGDGSHDELDGGSGSDLLKGGRGMDQLEGGSDSDVLKGGKGDDLLHGSIGDKLFGGLDEDIFQFSPAALEGELTGSVTIADFNAAEGDRVIFAGFHDVDYEVARDGDEVTITWTESYTARGGRGGMLESPEKSLTVVGVDADYDVLIR